MTLLEDIQNTAVDSKTDIATLLRKCKLLAARIGSQQLEDWVQWESSGYPLEAPIPEYRILWVQVKADFIGAFGSGTKNFSVPTAFLPEDAREYYSHFKCRQSIASIEAVLSSTSGGIAQINTGDLALYLGKKVVRNQSCIQAWAEIGTGQLVEITNAVRNRILDFALAVWKEAPNASEVGSVAPTSTQAETITQIFNTTVYGGSASLVGAALQSSIEFNIVAQDFSTLERLLLENHVPSEDLTELQAALDADQPASEPGRFGPRVSGWIARMVGKAAAGVWDIGIAAAGNLLSQAITKYYGL